MRTLYAQTEPRHLLRSGERVLGSVVRAGLWPEWYIEREPTKKVPKLRRHDGRLRKRQRR